MNFEGNFVTCLRRVSTSLKFESCKMPRQFGIRALEISSPNLLSNCVKLFARSKPRRFTYRNYTASSRRSFRLLLEFRITYSSEGEKRERDEQENRMEFRKMPFLRMESYRSRWHCVATLRLKIYYLRWREFSVRISHVSLHFTRRR